MFYRQVYFVFTLLKYKYYWRFQTKHNKYHYRILCKKIADKLPCRKYPKKPQTTASLVYIMLFSHLKSRVHTQQKLIIVLCPFESVINKFHSLNRCHVREILAQNPHTVERLTVKQQVIAAGRWCNTTNLRRTAVRLKFVCMLLKISQKKGLLSRVFLYKAIFKKRG